MADHDKPTVTSNYLDFVNEMHGRMDDLAVGFDPARTSATNVPNYSIRWSSAAKKWQYLDGSSWKDLTGEYDINIRGHASKLKTPRTIQITGGGTSDAVPFDGSANVQISLNSLNLANLTGLGSAATRDVVSSATDTSGGNKLITQGWMGLGTPLNVNWSVLNVRAAFNGAAGAVPDTPLGNFVLGFTVSNGPDNTVRIAGRRDNGGLWYKGFSEGKENLPWLEILTEGNILKTTGNNDNFPMSQKAVTDALNNIIVAPIGMCYTQYPGTETPSTLFGGTWTLMFNTEGVFFRTEGNNASNFGGGIQGDAIRNITGGIQTDVSGGNGNFVGPSGAFTVSNGGRRPAQAYGGSSAGNRNAHFSASNVVPTASENRPRNLTVRVWRKTAH